MASSWLKNLAERANDLLDRVDEEAEHLTTLDDKSSDNTRIDYVSESRNERYVSRKERKEDSAPETVAEIAGTGRRVTEETVEDRGAMQPTRAAVGPEYELENQKKKQGASVNELTATNRALNAEIDAMDDKLVELQRLCDVTRRKLDEEIKEKRLDQEDAMTREKSLLRRQHQLERALKEKQSSL